MMLVFNKTCGNQPYFLSVCLSCGWLHDAMEIFRMGNFFSHCQGY